MLALYAAVSTSGFNLSCQCFAPSFLAGCAGIWGCYPFISAACGLVLASSPVFQRFALVMVILALCSVICTDFAGFSL